MNENFNVDVWILNVQVLVVEDSRCSIKFKYLEQHISAVLCGHERCQNY